MTRIRQGDLVKIEARVKYITVGGKIVVDLGEYGVEVRESDVTAVEHNFLAGDTVIIGGGLEAGTVFGAVDGNVWVRHHSDNGFATYLATDLSLADPDDVQLEGAGPAEPPPRLPQLADELADA